MARQSNHPSGFHFDLPAVFRSALDYGRIVSDESAEQKGDETARARFLIHLNPRRREFGDDFQYRFHLCRPGGGAILGPPGHFNEVDLSADLHSADARIALKTLASAAVLLTGTGQFRVRGERLLGSGAWLLWQGMAEEDRQATRELLPEAIRFWGWSRNKAGVLKRHVGPTCTSQQGFGPVEAVTWRLATNAQFAAGLELIKAQLAEQRRYGQSTLDWFDLPFGRRVGITGLSCRVVVGSVPSVCRTADPVIPFSALVEKLPTLRRAMQIYEGLTLHWVGHEQGSRGNCPCHPEAPSAAPVERDRWPTPRVLPVWNATDRQLSYSNTPIATFRKKGKNLWAILDAFQKQGWPDEIELSIDGEQLYQAIRPLNRQIGKRGPIRFTVKKSKKLVRWDVVSGC